MVFDTEEDALQTKGYLDNPLYRWVIEQTRVSGRLNANIICKLPNAPIEEVLTADQLSYIQSQHWSWNSNTHLDMIVRIFPH